MVTTPDPAPPIPPGCEIVGCRKKWTQEVPIGYQEDEQTTIVSLTRVCDTHADPTTSFAVEDLPERAHGLYASGAPAPSVIELPDQQQDHGGAMSTPAKGMTILTDEEHANNIKGRISNLEADRAMQDVLLAEAKADPHDTTGEEVHSKNIETLDARLAVLRDAYDKALDAAVKAEKAAKSKGGE